MNAARWKLYLLIIAVVLTGLVGSSLLWLQRAAAEVQAEDDHLRRARLLQQQIEQLRPRQHVAEAHLLETIEIHQRIEAAAEAAGLQSTALDRIHPEGPRRVGDSNYLEAPVRLRITRVEMRQIITLLHRLADDGSGLLVRQVRLSAPRGEEPANVWNVEITLAYLLYQPPRN